MATYPKLIDRTMKGYKILRLFSTTLRICDYKISLVTKSIAFTVLLYIIIKLLHKNLCYS